MLVKRWSSQPPNEWGCLAFRHLFAYDVRMEHSPRHREKDGRTLVLAAAIIIGLRLARDPRAGSLTERVIYAIEDGLFLANQIYDKALFRFGDVIGFKWEYKGRVRVHRAFYF
jgi:hypothetical protein